MTLIYVPYLEQPSLRVGPITVHAFGIIVAVAVSAGLMIGKQRFKSMGLDTALGERMGWWVLAGGFLGAHLFSVLFYFPREVQQDPLILLRVWEDISSFGGILGGALALWLFLRYRAPTLEASTRWAYAEVACYAFAISLMIGRIACTLAHDHPGTITAFPLAVSLHGAEARAYIETVYADAGRSAELPAPNLISQLGFHDLGWYEFLYLAVVVVPVMIFCGRAAAPGMPRQMISIFLGLYMPVRFLLDFLRVSDARYGGLTPAQWLALASFVAVPWIYSRAQRAQSRPAVANAPSGSIASSS